MKVRKIIVLFLFIVFTSLEGTNIRKFLYEISSEDRSALCSLFSSLIEDHFAYTLFGDKPVSLSAHFVLTPWENTIEKVSSDGLFWKKWQIFQSYRNRLPLKNFILIQEPSKTKNWQISNVILINKRAFIEIVKSHLKIFEGVLGKKINPQKMLKSIEDGKISLVDSINNNQMLWGILLGYGSHNAALYNKQDREYLNLGDFTKYSQINLEPIGDYHYSPLRIGSVYFAGDLEHPQTKALQQKYQKLRGKISAIYAKGDFLEITLSKLTEE